jgi:xanthine/uracil permease
MAVSLSRITLKLIEILVKMIILSCFLATILFWTGLYFIYMPSKFNIDFIATNSCFYAGRQWNYDDGICMWVEE